MGAFDCWARRLAACEAQGVSINAYTMRERLSAISLYYCRKLLELTGSPPREVVAVQFVPSQVRRSSDCSDCFLLVFVRWGPG